MCLLCYVIKVCAASEFAGVAVEFVKQSSLPKVICVQCLSQKTLKKGSTPCLNKELDCV